jgi:hypothetical protein
LIWQFYKSCSETISAEDHLKQSIYAERKHAHCTGAQLNRNISRAGASGEQPEQKETQGSNTSFAGTLYSIIEILYN